VAGLLRREPRIGVWSTVTTPSRPDTEPWISELLPSPPRRSRPQDAEREVDVHVVQVVGARAAYSSVPEGVRTVGLRRARSSRCRPVTVAAARSPATVPWKQTVPPVAPAPGPRSTTWSAIAMTSGLCSTTRTVLPLSRSRRRRSFIRRTSCGWSPTVGSSNT